LVYIVFFAVGETGQRQSVPSWIRKFAFKEVDSVTVTIPPSSSSKLPPIISMSTISPVHHLPSFWDDASDSKLHRQTQRSPPKRKEDLKLKPDECTPPSSPEVDDSFKEATLTYVSSPTGRRALDTEAPSPPQIEIASPSDTPRASDASDEVVADVNRASPLLNASWPQAPKAVASSTSSTFSTPNGHSRSLSPTTHMSFGSSLYEDTDPAHLQDSAPFRGSGVPTTPPSSPAPGRSILKHVKKRTSSGSIRRNMDNREGNYGLRPEDVIYMTVVKEISV